MTVDFHDFELDHVMVWIPVLVNVVGQDQRIGSNVRGIHEGFHGNVVGAFDKCRNIVGIVRIAGSRLLDLYPFNNLGLSPFGRSAAIAERFGLTGFDLGCLRCLEDGRNGM